MSAAQWAPGWLRPLGNTGLQVSAVCVGGGPLGSMPQAFGYQVPESDAVELVEAVLDSPIRFIDTANAYSDGRSEERIGLGIKAYGGLPPDFVVATKVDAKDGDYSGARVTESIKESQKRLGLEWLPLVYLHDPEYFSFEELTRPGGAVETLFALAEAGEIGAVGLAGGDTRVMRRYFDLGGFQVALIHNRWTLVDRSAKGYLERVRCAGAAVVNAAIYGGGILANPAGGSTTYGYREASAETLAAIAAMAQVCADYGTDLPTAALMASVRDHRISTTIVGMSKVSRLEKTLAATKHLFDDSLWRDLESLLPSEPNWLDWDADNGK